MNPETGCPAWSGLISVTAAADSGALADALTTSLFIMGLDAAMAHWRAYRDFESAFITDARELHITEGLEPRSAAMGDYAQTAVTVVR